MIQESVYAPCGVPEEKYANVRTKIHEYKISRPGWFNIELDKHILHSTTNGICRVGNVLFDRDILLLLPTEEPLEEVE